MSPTGALHHFHHAMLSHDIHESPTTILMSLINPWHSNQAFITHRHRIQAVRIGQKL
jgi:hypothetical protein